MSVSRDGSHEGDLKSALSCQAASTQERNRLKIASHGTVARFGAGPDSVHALGPFNLDVHEGEFLCLVGPSGCGKSTFIRQVAGLLEPSSGRIELWAGEASPKIVTAMVFQDYGIFPWMTVEANVSLGLEAQGVKKREAQKRAVLWIERLGLGQFRRALPATLSGGMRQRVAIARALAVEPDILLMDEPFAALDAQLREILQEELLTLSQAISQTVIFVTHSLDEAIILGDRVVVMTGRPGRVSAEIDVPFPRPRDTSVRESEEFGRLRHKLWGVLRDEVDGNRLGGIGE